MTEKADQGKGSNREDGDNHNPVKIRKRTLVISILVISAIVGSLITSSIFSSSLFTISSTHAQQPDRTNPEERIKERQALADQRTTCTPPKRLCGNSCINPSSDNRHCGRCFNPCGVNFQCTDGLCAHQLQCVGGTEQCTIIPRSPLGPIAGCVDTKYNKQHCGGCNIPCGGNDVCENGVCVKAKICDKPAQEFCRGTCMDQSSFKSDVNNCGRCGIVCNQGACVNGRCEATGCPTGTTRCGFDPTTNRPICVDTNSDPKHCGGCIGDTCAAGASCNNGVCECPAGHEVLRGSVCCNLSFRTASCCGIW